MPFPRHTGSLHCIGTRVPRCLGVAHSASGPKAAQALRCTFTPGMWVKRCRVTCMARAASVPGLRTLSFLLLCRFCLCPSMVAGGLQCVCRYWFCVSSANPGSGLRRAFLGMDFAFTPPVLTGFMVCLGRVSPAPRHSWLGCGVCVFVRWFCLYPANRSLGCAVTAPILARVYGVCWGAIFACTPPSLAGLWGMCVHLLAPHLPRRSWPGLVTRMLVSGSCLHPATTGLGVVCVCVFVR